MDESNRTERLAALDHAHVWHPFTPMRQWREREPVIIERGDGDYLIDTRGRRYIDGVSSMWCTVHGHHVPQIDQAIREQLDRVAHSTMLGLASVPSIELAEKLVELVKAPSRQGGAESERQPATPDADASTSATNVTEQGAPKAPPCRDGALNKVFYSDAGATALEVAFKMAVGYWYHTGRPRKHKFIGFTGAYHGDTTGSMSVGYSEVFHKPYASLVFPTFFAPVPDALRALQHPNTQSPPTPVGGSWPSECVQLNKELTHQCLDELEILLKQHNNEIAGIVIEPIMQGAAGMVSQPPGFLRGVADLAKKYNTLLIADEVATGFGRTAKMFACEHENVTPGILCLGKGLTGGYLPLAATLCTDAIASAFEGDLEERRTLYHGHTFCGNPLACAAAIASIELFEKNNLLEHIWRSTALVSKRLDALRDPRDFAHIVDVRQRGLMIGIELDPVRPRSLRWDPSAPASAAPADDYGSPLGAALCDAMRQQGLIIRPLGNVLVLMPVLAIKHDTLNRMLDIVIDTLRNWRF